MSVARRPRATRSSLVVLAAALALPVLAVPGVAAADGPRVLPDTVVGELVQAWPEHADQEEAAEHGGEGPLSFIRTADGGSVRVDTGEVDHLPLGSTVEVTVGQSFSDDASRDEGFEKARDVLAAEVVAPVAPAVSPVNHTVSVVMAVPAGGTRDSATLGQVVAAVEGPVAEFWSAESNGVVNVGIGATRDWVDLPVGCSDPYALWNAAAQTVGFTSGAGKHLLVYLPQTGTLPGCSDGLGTVGTGPGSGGYTYVRGSKPSIIAHELGHNVGLGHSSAVQCDGVVQGRTCRTTSYWDLYDVMGASWDQMGSLNVAQASRIYDVAPKVFPPRSTPETVTLAPVSQRSGVRAIVLRDSAGTQYWLEFRPATGRDGWLGTSDNWFGLQPGVLLRRAAAGNDTSLLLDATPSPIAGWDADDEVRLPVGTTIRIDDAASAGTAAFMVRVQEVTDARAIVEVTPATPIDIAHDAAGGDAGVLGPATAPESCVTRSARTFCERPFQRGTLYWSLSSGAHYVTAPVLPAYVAAGGTASDWGMPTTDTVCGRVGGGCVQTFDAGADEWASSPGTGGFLIRGRIADVWRASGREAGALGYPLADRTCVDGLCRQPFERGLVAGGTATGTFAVRADIAAPWAARGHEAGPLGWPVSALVCGLANGGCGQVFQGGRIYTAPGAGAHAVSGAIHAAWVAQGYERGPLGYATGDEVCGTGGGCTQAFQGGLLYAHASVGVRTTSVAVATAWDAAGGAGGVLGQPTSNLICGLKDGGCGQVFQGGIVYSTARTGAHALSGVVKDAWVAQGYENGELGYPTSDLVCGLPGSACKQGFQGGTLYSHPTAGMRTVTGAVHAVWTAAGSEAGPLGHPTSGLVCGLRDGGCGQVFSGGIVYSTARTGTHAVTGDVKDAWVAQGYENGPLGYPASGLICGLAGGGCGQAFQGGRIYAGPGTGAHALSGAVQSAWIAQGWEAGPLGYPTGDVVCGVAGGCSQAFQGGTLYSHPVAGTRTVAGSLAAAYAAAGGAAGTLGYPTSGLICGLKDGGCGQVFQGGTIYDSPGNGVHALTGRIRAAWMAQGYELGPLGYPTGDQVCGLAASGCSQTFQGGTVWSSPATGAQAVTGAVATAYAAAGGVGGALGYPTSGLICGLKDGGCGQVFQGGRIYDSPGSGAHAVTGAIHTAWVAQRWELGPLGYATADQVCGLAGGGCVQQFQGGTLYAHPTAGTYPVSGDVAAAYARAGGESGALGYPTSGLICGLKQTGCGQVFQGGRIYTTPGTGAHAVSGAIHTAWVERGYETGVLGYATEDQVCGLAGGGCSQRFQSGTLYWHPGTGAHRLSGRFLSDYVAAGGPAVLGYPASDVRSVRGEDWDGYAVDLRSGPPVYTCGSGFEGRAIYWSPTSVGFSPVVLSGDILVAFEADLAGASSWGPPTGQYRATDGNGNTFWMAAFHHKHVIQDLCGGPLS
ncbi:reprolysin-like metallopeptidase [Blastococcus litoris]|uniref:reprolysin-like metallopeptidase n=1 Tax=Blastococcus litoris TaxID=2171622 RepID=UPI0013E08424|nr:hypothetical protein [Blastococcus litoris]